MKTFFVENFHDANLLSRTQKRKTIENIFKIKKHLKEINWFYFCSNIFLSGRKLLIEDLSSRRIKLLS